LETWLSVYSVFMIIFAQSTARSSSPSFSGPSESFTKNPSGGIIRLPPFFSSLYAMGLA
ncbi:unnamed protein product, partial [marine sediment metagenome]